eukprot:g21084.t1
MRTIRRYVRYVRGHVWLPLSLLGGRIEHESQRPYTATRRGAIRLAVSRLFWLGRQARHVCFRPARNPRPRPPPPSCPNK